MRPPPYSTKSLIIIWNNHKNKHRSTISDGFRYLTKNLIHIYSETKPTWKVWQNYHKRLKSKNEWGMDRGREVKLPHRNRDLIVWPGKSIKCIVSHSPTYLFYLFFSFNSFLYLCLCYRLIFLIIEKRSRWMTHLKKWRRWYLHIYMLDCVI